MRQLVHIVALFLLIPLIIGCGTSVQPGQMGLKKIVMRKPALEEKARPEGFYFQWPWNSTVMYDVTWQTKDETVEILSADDLHVPTSVSVTYRPKVEELHRLATQIGQDYFNEIIRPVFLTLVRSAFSQFNHNDLARESPAIENKIREGLISRLAEMPVEIDQVAITHIEFDRDVTRAISEKLMMEQRAEQKVYEIKIAEQDAEIDRIRAQGMGDAIRIQAEGEAQAIVIKGQAQATAQGAITATLTKGYLQYKAFDGSSTRYYFVPIGKDGLPIIVDAGSAEREVDFVP